MNFLIPVKIGDNGKVDMKAGSSNGLDLSLQSDVTNFPFLILSKPMLDVHTISHL